jgi:hypothetical protein
MSQRGSATIKVASGLPDAASEARLVQLLEYTSTQELEPCQGEQQRMREGGYACRCASEAHRGGRRSI